jgi:hypothetical protein
VLRDGPGNNQGVVGILKDRARKVIDQGVEKQPVTRSPEEKLLKHIGDNVKEEGGERVPLPKPTSTLDPASGDPVKEDGGLASIVK